MKILLVPDEIMLDSSFPRNDGELSIVCSSMGTLYGLVAEEKISLILTNTLQGIVESADWGALANSGMYVELQKFLSQLFLSQHDGLVRMNLDSFSVDEGSYPKISGMAENQGLVDLWLNEVALLLKMHSEVVESDDHYIGIACTYGFSGGTKREYSDASGEGFPIVCDKSYIQIKSPLRYNIDKNIHNKSVSVAEAENNLHILGGKIGPERGSSHRSVTFVGGSRSWVLDTNDDPIPERYLKQIEDIIHKDFRYILHVLIEGEEPDTVHIFQDYII